MPNRLSTEKSPYLLQHKDNPVNWYPWCDDAFAEARARDIPILLSIGYSTCHWCHVMARESFENEKIAEFLNDNFVCIKVDREERPDIDAVYMSVCQALTGSGGWPLNVFLTAEQKPFYAGTYFPPESGYGRIGFYELLSRIAHLWNTNREALYSSGSEIMAAVSENARVSGEPGKSLFNRAYGIFRETYDPAYGGFGRAPKFPSSHNLMFLMDYSCLENSQSAMDMAENTLKNMYRGGIFDHIGGGFSRYSTDEKWLVPHFEKMLYDNALLIMSYTAAFKITKNPLYEDIIRRTADYILRELTSPDGGFYCGQDADSDGVEGKYYLLSRGDAVSVLGEDDGGRFCSIYNIPDSGMGIPNRIGAPGTEWARDDERLKKLYNFRRERTHLVTDDKILTSWSSWAIIALARAGYALQEKRYTEAALKCHTFIDTFLTSDDVLFHRYRDGEAAYPGQLDDYAVYSLALTELYKTSYSPEYLRRAACLARKMTELFQDEGGGLCMTARDGEKLIMRPKETYDGAIPSGNSVAGMVLSKLSCLTGDTFFTDAAHRQLKFLAGAAYDYPAGFTFALSAMLPFVYPRKDLVCVSSENAVPPELKTLSSERYTPCLTTLFKSPENGKLLADCSPFTADYPIPPSGRLWYLCENGACKPPETDFKDLKL